MSCPRCAVMVPPEVAVSDLGVCPAWRAMPTRGQGPHCALRFLRVEFEANPPRAEKTRKAGERLAGGKVSVFSDLVRVHMTFSSIWALSRQGGQGAEWGGSLPSLLQVISPGPQTTRPEGPLSRCCRNPRWVLRTPGALPASIALA